MGQDQNKALFFDVRVTMKERSTTHYLKEGVCFSFNFGCSSN